MARKPRAPAGTPPSTDTPFRAAERKWKSRRVPPNLAESFDVAAINWHHDQGLWTNPETGAEVPCSRFELDWYPMDEGKGKDRESREQQYAIVLPAFPGLVILPALLSPRLQRALTVESLHHTKLPNLTSLSAHYALPEAGLWSTWIQPNGGREKVKRVDRVTRTKEKRVRIDFEPITKENWRGAKGRGALPAEVPELGEVEGNEDDEKEVTIDELLSRLRWTNLGWHYNWTAKAYDFERGAVPLPPLIERCCKDLVRAIDWGRVFPLEKEGGNELWKDWVTSYRPEAGVINFYQLKDSLTAHIDQSEIDSVRPLVSFSIGHSAIFLLGGPTRDHEPLAILLRSGDGLIMSGEKTRRVFHGLPRVLEGTLPPYLRAAPPSLTVEGGDPGDTEWTPYGTFLERGTRININVREVF